MPYVRPAFRAALRPVLEALPFLSAETVHDDPLPPQRLTHNRPVAWAPNRQDRSRVRRIGGARQRVSATAQVVLISERSGQGELESMAEQVIDAIWAAEGQFLAASPAVCIERVAVADPVEVSLQIQRASAVVEIDYSGDQG